MPLCIVCKTRFDSAGWSAPAEPCDCGACWQEHPDDPDPPDPERLAEARRQWAAGEDMEIEP